MKITKRIEKITSGQRKTTAVAGLVAALALACNGCNPSNPTRQGDYSSCTMNWMTVHRDNDVGHATFIQKCMFAKGYALAQDDPVESSVCRPIHNDSALCYRR